MGERVVQLQTALIAEGYPIAADGTYGPRTQAAVRDFQARNGLEVDGIAGPRTQAALGIGPGGEQATSETTQPAPATTTTTVAARDHDDGGGAGAPVECTAAAIGADMGRTVDEISACHAGWAIAPLPSCPAGLACPRSTSSTSPTPAGCHDGSSPAGCAEDLHEAGMSAYTAGDFAPWCGVPNLPAERLVIEPGRRRHRREQLQIALVALGYPIAVDGTYGPGTEQAVRDFQERNGLEVDGIAGPTDPRAARALALRPLRPVATGVRGDPPRDARHSARSGTRVHGSGLRRRRRVEHDPHLVARAIVIRDREDLHGARRRLRCCRCATK